MAVLEFKEINIADKNIVEPYFIKYGNGSCQYSFASSICRKSKYHDCYCIYNDFLIVLRQGISSENEYKFMFPLGEANADLSNIKDVFEQIKLYCKENKTACSFVLVTRPQFDLFTKIYSDNYSYVSDRNYYEYVYEAEDIRNLAGQKYASRRNEINTFNKMYGNSVEITRIDYSDINDIRSFQRKWLDEGKEHNENIYELLLEAEEVEYALRHYDELDLEGVVIRINGVVRGYAIGSVISEETFDGIFAKGDREIKHIYSKLFCSHIRLCGEYCRYVNWEEDLGIASLRSVKESYRPCRLIEKINLSLGTDF